MNIANKEHPKNWELPIQKGGEVDLINLFPDCNRESYGINECIFTPLKISDNIFFLISGKVKVTNVSEKGRVISCGYYRKGDLINLEIINSMTPTELTAESKSKDTVALVIPKGEFLQKLTLSHRLQQFVFGQLLKEKANTEQRIQRLLDVKSYGRVCDFLFHHALRFGDQIGYEYVIREPITHKEIGEYIGCSRQTVTTALNLLRRERIIHFNRRYLIIRDLKRLKKRVDEF